MLAVFFHSLQVDTSRCYSLCLWHCWCWHVTWLRYGVSAVHFLGWNTLEMHVNYQYVFRDTCILALMETWLEDKDSDHAMSIHGFFSKPCGGGVCIYVNNRWCKTAVVRKYLCTKDLELLCPCSIFTCLQNSHRYLWVWSLTNAP